MTFHRLMIRTLAFLGACALIAASKAALATPAVQITMGSFHRDQSLHPNPNTYSSISKADCELDDTLHFSVVLTEPIGLQLDVWAGLGNTDCTDKATRTTIPSCTQVFTTPATSTSQIVDIKARDIVLVTKSVYGAKQGAGTLDACENATGSATAQQVTLYFMLTQSADIQGTSANWPGKVDLIGPSQPTEVSAEGASSFVKVNWKQSIDTADVAGYQFFCDPPPGGASDASIDATTTPPAPVCPDASAATTDASDDAETGSTGADACVSGQGGTSAGNCGGFNFIPGSVPSADVIAAYSCGSQTAKDATSSNIEGFGTRAAVAVAVAAFDLVNNVGPLSTVSCTQTEPVNGFIDLYHSAGGTAGGGFCSIGAGLGQRISGRLAYLFGVFAAIAAIRRRRSAASN